MMTESSSALAPVETAQGQTYYLNLPKVTVGLHNTTLGESLYHIASEQTNSKNPKVVKAYLKKLIAVNRETLRAMGIPPSKASLHRPMPFTTFVLPKKGSGIEYPALRKALTHAKQINRLPVAQREALHKMINHPDLDPTTFSSVAMLSSFMQFLKSTGESIEKNIDPSIFASLGLAIADRYVEALKEMAGDLKSALAKTETRLGEYLQATDEDKKSAREAFLESHHELNEHFNKAVKHLNTLQMKVKSGGYYKNAQTLVKLRKQGKIVKLFDLDAFSAASRALKLTKFIGAGFVVMDFTEIGYDTAKSYHKGEDWVAELAEDLGSFSVGTLLGGAILTALGVINAPLLIVIAAGGVSTIVFTDITKKFLDIFFKKYSS